MTFSTEGTEQDIGALLQWHSVLSSVGPLSRPQNVGAGSQCSSVALDVWHPGSDVALENSQNEYPRQKPLNLPIPCTSCSGAQAWLSGTRLTKAERERALKVNVLSEMGRVCEGNKETRLNSFKLAGSYFLPLYLAAKPSSCHHSGSADDHLRITFLVWQRITTEPLIIIFMSKLTHLIPVVSFRSECIINLKVTLHMPVNRKGGRWVSEAAFGTTVEVIANLKVHNVQLFLRPTEKKETPLCVLPIQLPEDKKDWEGDRRRAMKRKGQVWGG